MKYAVIKLQGKQYRVEEGQELTVDRMDGEVDSSINLSEVLLYSDNGNLSIGTPVVDGAKVQVKIKDHNKAKKIRVATFKAKSRFRKVRGHRQHETVLLIEKIALK